MKIILKNVKQVAHDVEISSDAITVLELKKEIEAQHNFEANSLKLLFNGVVLDDTKTVASYSIKEGNSIIMITTKGKVIMNKPKDNPIQQHPPLLPLNPNVIQKGNTVNQPQISSKPKEVAVVPAQKENEYMSEIKTLMEMGFSKEESGNAIKAAKGSVQIAIEFLYNGLPDQEMGDDYVDIEMNQDHDNHSYEDDNEGNDQHDPNENAGENYPMDEDEDEGANEGDNDLNLQKVSSVVKVLYSQDPSNLEGILMSVQQNSPEILQIIQENQEEFQNMLKEPISEEDLKNFAEFKNEGKQEQEQLPNHQGEENDDNNANNSNSNIQLTNDEYEAIKTIQEMGNFNEMETVQAYLACDKNVEMAANYLFENKANNNYGKYSITYYL